MQNKNNEIKFTIPLNPITKKNSKIIKSVGKPLIFKNKQYWLFKQLRLINGKKYTNYEKVALQLIKFLYKGGPISEKVNVKAMYYRKTKHTVDLNNLHSALHDTLVKGGVLKDDDYKIIESTDGSRVRFDKENPRTEVTITRVEEIE